MDTKLTNIETGEIIELNDDLYPSEEHDWSAVAQSQSYTLDGTLLIEQSVRLAGKPYTMQAPDDVAWLTRSTVNALKAERDKLGATFWLDYIADGAVKRIKVIFDNSDSAITATPVKGFISPNADDYYNVSLKLLEIPST